MYSRAPASRPSFICCRCLLVVQITYIHEQHHTATVEHLSACVPSSCCIRYSPYGEPFSVKTPTDSSGDEGEEAEGGEQDEKEHNEGMGTAETFVRRLELILASCRTRLLL